MPNLNLSTLPISAAARRRLDKRYAKNEQSIHSALHSALAHRRLNLRVRDLCQSANISSPTFYLHCRNPDDALRVYERHLLSEFRRHLPARLKSIIRSASATRPKSAQATTQRTTISSTQATPTTPPHLNHHDREALFSYLLNFIYTHRDYFAATIIHGNVWVLIRIFEALRPALAPPRLSPKAYDHYMSALIGAIFCWGKYDHFHRRSLPHYSTKMSQIRLLDFGL